MEFKGQIEYVNEEDGTNLFFTYSKIEKELYDSNVCNKSNMKVPLSIYCIYKFSPYCNLWVNFSYNFKRLKPLF
jgi:hypothetical protein